MTTTADDAALLDTNVLLTATTPARALHRNAFTVLNEWPSRGVPLWVSGQVLREYLVVATHSLWYQTQELEDEIVRRQCIKTERLKGLGWKVPDVVRDDHASSAADCRSQNMTISRIREIE